MRAAVTVVLFAVVLAFLLTMRGYQYDWNAVWGDSGYVSLFVQGLWTTFYISMLSLVLGTAFGIAAGLMRMSRNVIWDQIGTVYVELVRGTPLLVQIALAYFCFAPVLQSVLEGARASAGIVSFSQHPVLIGVLALSIFSGAYIAEIVRAALESIDKGQTEAALSQGMTRAQVFRLVLFPQAIRRMLPPMTGQFVNLVKDSSLLSIIGVAELTFQSSKVRSSTYATFEVLIPLAVFYLAITFPLARFSARLERKQAA